MLQPATPGSSHAKSYIAGIDGLRAIAVLSVILFHIHPASLPGGFVGVDIFFVISGYVVSGSLARETGLKFWEFSLRFYARRIVRIYPALIACVVLAGILQTLLVPTSWLSTASNKTAILSLFGLSNFALIWFNDGYFSPRVEFNAFTHTWSLAVEEQFYLLFPALFYGWSRSKEIRGRLGLLLKWLLPLLLLASLVLCWFETSQAPDRAFYLLPSRLWELACGAMLYRMHAGKRALAYTSLGLNVISLLGLILIAAGIIYSEPNRFPFPWAIASVMGTSLIIMGVTSAHHLGLERSSLVRVLVNRPMIAAGKLSYSLYLWHWPVLVLFRWTLGLDSPAAMGGAVLILSVLSVGSYYLVERPIRRSQSLLRRQDSFVVKRGALVTASSLAFLVLIFQLQPLLSLSTTKDRRMWYPEAWTEKNTQPAKGAKLLGEHKIFAIGDSHVGAYSTLFEMLKEEHGVEVVQFTQSGCAVANLINPPSARCAEFVQATVANVKRVAKSGDIVFLASLRMNRLGDQWMTFDESEVKSNQNSPAAEEQRLLALHAADSLVSTLTDAGLVVVLDAPKPVFRSPPFRCSDYFNSQNPVCRGGLSMSREDLLSFRAPVMKSLDILAKSHPELVVWDGFPMLCPKDPCSAFDDVGPLFFDGDHLSAHGNRVLYPSFVSLIKAAWAQKGIPP